MYRLRIFEGGSTHTLPLSASIMTIGCSPDNDVALASKDIPEVALRLTMLDGGFAAAAASPKAKPFHNGKRMEEFTFRPGDLVELGSARLLLETETASAPKGAPAGEALRDVFTGLTSLSAMVAEERDLKALLEKAMRLLLETLGGNEALLFTVGADGKPAVAVSTRAGGAEPMFSDTVVQQVLRAGKGVVLGNALSDPAYARSHSVVELNLRSVLCCPILAAGKLSGLMYLGSNLPSVSFGERELREMEVYALVVGCLINHVGYGEMQSRVLASLIAESGHPGFIAACPPMQAVVREARAVASGDISVLLEGETGTGKDLLANFIHRSSRRGGKPFLAVNCSTLRGELLASELFGHRKGAFTGALQDQKGIFQSADGGTLFLDEIGEMELPLQAMLLRTLESGMVRPVGQAAEVKVDVRILCATNRKLEAMISEGTFRQDLFYRINQHCISMPPLRDRGEDVLLLAQWYLEKAKGQYPDKKLTGFSAESLFAMARYRWPGNVRELANVVSKAGLFADSPVLNVSFPQSQERWMNMDEATRRFQADYLQKALDLCGGDKDKAAAMLGMGRSTFFRHLAEAKS